MDTARWVNLPGTRRRRRKGSDMVQTWQSEERGEVTCPKCGAVYEKKVHRIPMKDVDSFNCVTCGELIDRWNSTHVPNYTLKQRGKTQG